MFAHKTLSNASRLSPFNIIARRCKLVAFERMALHFTIESFGHNVILSIRKEAASVAIAGVATDSDMRWCGHSQ
jgi:hypothetical protein